jgi:hypothetical protein
MYFTLAKCLEKGIPLSLAKDQSNLDVDVKMLNVQSHRINAIMKTRKVEAGLLLVA